MKKVLSPFPSDAQLFLAPGKSFIGGRCTKELPGTHSDPDCHPRQVWVLR
jgi:hypothetical protein